MMSEERNSSGERLYTDLSGAKCNIWGMIRREPDWVAARFGFMEARIAELEAEMEQSPLLGELRRIAAKKCEADDPEYSPHTDPNYSKREAEAFDEGQRCGEIVLARVLLEKRDGEED